MEWHTLKNVNSCLSTNIYYYLETSGGQSSYLLLNVVHFLTPLLFRHLWQLKTVIFLHWCLIRALLLVSSVQTFSKSNWERLRRVVWIQWKSRFQIHIYYSWQQWKCITIYNTTEFNLHQKHLLQMHKYVFEQCRKFKTLNNIDIYIIFSFYTLLCLPFKSCPL